VQEKAVASDKEVPAVPVFLVGGMLIGCKAAAVLFPVTYLIASNWTEDAASLTMQELIQRLFGQAIAGGVLGLALGVHMGLLAASCARLQRSIPLPYLRAAITAIGGLLGALLAAAFTWFGSERVNIFLTPKFWTLLGPLVVCGAYCCYRLGRLFKQPLVT